MTTLPNVIPSLATKPQINVPLLRKSLEYAQEHPEEIDLSVWATRTICGTTACLAGTAVVLAGLKIDWSTATSISAWYVTDGRLISAAAADELGLGNGDATWLFYQDTLKACWEIAGHLTNGEIQCLTVD